MNADWYIRIPSRCLRGSPLFPVRTLRPNDETMPAARRAPGRRRRWQRKWMFSSRSSLVGVSGLGAVSVSHGRGRSPELFNHSGPAVSMMNALYVAHDGVDHNFAPARERVRGCHLAFEDAREGRAVGDVEEAQRADRHVQVDLVDPVAERARGPAAPIDVTQGRNGRKVQLFDAPRPCEMDAVVDILDHHQANEALIGVLIVERESDERPQGRFWLDLIEFERCLDVADAAVGLFEHLGEEPLLVAKVVVDHPLAGVGASRNVVDAGPAEALVGELVRGDLQNVPSGAVAVLGPPLGVPKPAGLAAMTARPEPLL